MNVNNQLCLSHPPKPFVPRWAGPSLAQPPKPLNFIFLTKSGRSHIDLHPFLFIIPPKTPQNYSIFCQLFYILHWGLSIIGGGNPCEHQPSFIPAPTHVLPSHYQSIFDYKVYLKRSICGVTHTHPLLHLHYTINRWFGVIIVFIGPSFPNKTLN